MDVRKDREKILEYEQVKKISQKHGKIVSIQRYSAYIMVQYSNIIEFFEFESRNHL